MDVRCVPVGWLQVKRTARTQGKWHVLGYVGTFLHTDQLHKRSRTSQNWIDQQ